MADELKNLLQELSEKAKWSKDRLHFVFDEKQIELLRSLSDHVGEWTPEWQRQS